MSDRPTITRYRQYCEHCELLGDVSGTKCEACARHTVWVELREKDHANAELKLLNERHYALVEIAELNAYDNEDAVKIARKALGWEKKV